MKATSYDLYVNIYRTNNWEDKIQVTYEWGVRSMFRVHGHFPSSWLKCSSNLWGERKRKNIHWYLLSMSIVSQRIFFWYSEYEESLFKRIKHTHYDNVGLFG